MPLSALQASAYLHHLHLGSDDPARLADFYKRAMQMTAEKHADGAFLLRGPNRRLLISRGKPKALLQAGFALRDPEGLNGLRSRADAHGLKPSDARSPFFAPGAFAVTDP